MQLHDRNNRRESRVLLSVLPVITICFGNGVCAPPVILIHSHLPSLSAPQVQQIFASIGVSMSPEVFQKLWAEAARRDPKGQVCKAFSLHS